jgi:hypothetical protein
LPRNQPASAGILKSKKIIFMKIPKITMPFSGMSDSNFETKAQSIYARMLGNAYFANPTPTLAALLEAINAYSAALTLAQTREKNAVALKNDARAAVTALLIQLASFVMTAANGDKTKLISSGYDLASEGGVTNLEKPTSIELMDGKNAGELVVKIPSVKGAKSYGPQYTSDPLTADNQWVQVITTTSKYTFNGLGSGKKYWCRVAAVGPYGQVVYSDAISRVVQ